MSTVGKVLVVAQIAFSILLMAFAAGVGSVQTNWKKKADAAEKSLATTTKQLTDAKSLSQKDKDKAVATENRSKMPLTWLRAPPMPPRSRSLNCNAN